MTSQDNSRSGHNNSRSGHNNNRFPDNSRIHTANPNGTSHRKWVEVRIG
jgi:hypothetical protein